MSKRAILHIGDEPVLSTARREILNEWDVTTIKSEEALSTLTRNPGFKLVIFCHTVPEGLVTEIANLVTRLKLDSRLLLLSDESRDRRVDARIALFPQNILRPGSLCDAVAELLEEERSPV